MNSTQQLPLEYGEIYRMDLQNNKKQLLLVNAISLLIGGAMMVPLFFGNALRLFLAIMQLPQLLALLAGMIGYVLLHELVHGIFMFRFSGLKPKYGFTGLYAYAGSDAYFCRKHYLIIGLSPIVVWGLVLAGLQFLVPESWVMAVYLIQVMNLSGAAGDLFVTWKMMRMPPDILVQDSGVAMTVYSRAGKKI